MANTTSGMKWVHGVTKLCKVIQDEADALGMGRPESLPQGTITIEVESGMVIAVRGLPDGYQYEILDHDMGSEQ